MNARGLRLLPLLALAVGALAPSEAAPAPTARPAPAARRAALLRLAEKGPAGLPVIAASLQDENVVVRRTAARILAGMGQPAGRELERALANTDFLVRRTALSALCQPVSVQCLPYLEQALKDPEAAMRLTAVNLLVLVEPRSEAVNALLNVAAADKATEIRDIATRATWPFHRDKVLLRDRKDWDHEVKLLQAIPLSKGGWRFKTDVSRDGHVAKWFAPDLDDSGWAPIETERAWEQQGHPFDGVAWYRTTFELPAKPDLTAAELRFEGVDECAWVWLNGVYVGQHDLGPQGWDQPFSVDITQEARWGQKNQLTVRVFDSVQAGGIWKPVKIELLK